MAQARPVACRRAQRLVVRSFRPSSDDAVVLPADTWERDMAEQHKPGEKDQTSGTLLLI
jgi:hypothetical protein